MRRAMTLVEIITVIGIITLLLAILLPALSVARGNSVWAGSQNNLRQISTYLQAYTTDNREYLVPSQFDYSASPYPGKVRTPSPAGTTLPLGQPNQGTWTDILWTSGEFGPVVGSDVTGSPDYRYDSPDKAFYETRGDDVKNIFRSMGTNSRQAVLDGQATPFGAGADEAGAPGYFAANDFFNARADAPGGGKWWTSGQIKRPDRSIYLVDSYFGEVIPTTDEAWAAGVANSPTCEVDFRYPGNLCLMLLLDGSIRSEPRWTDLSDLLNSRQLRVTGLHLN
ncbi:MAG: hypothetical protein KDA22_04855 [Phycisphaerales bacterium]|nr:hypothetical protein [Phycisphaerales bacterium]